MNDRDPAQYHEASEWPDMAERLDSPVDALAEEMASKVRYKGVAVPYPLCQQMAAVALSAASNTGGANVEDIAKRILCEVIDAPTGDDALMNARCLDFVFGLGIQGGISQTQIAELHDCTRATVSRKCRLMVRRFSGLGVKPGPGMRSEEAVKTYSIRELQKQRKVKAKWRYRGRLKIQETTKEDK